MVDIPEEVVAALIACNRTHFGQAHGTPFTVPPLSTDLGFSGDQPAADDILHGTYDDSSLDDATRSVVAQLRADSQILDHVPASM